MLKNTSFIQVLPEPSKIRKVLLVSLIVVIVCVLPYDCCYIDINYYVSLNVTCRNPFLSTNFTINVLLSSLLITLTPLLRQMRFDKQFVKKCHEFDKAGTIPLKSNPKAPLNLSQLLLKPPNLLSR